VVIRLRVLLVALLLLNGVAGSDAFAATDMDCCGGASCECGCAAPQVMSLPPSLPRGAWSTALPEFVFEVRSFQAGPRSVPFRPPA